MTGLTQSGSVGAGVVTTPSGTLAANTTYTFYVRSDCSGSGFSTWAASSSFMTPCANLALNVTEGFEAGTTIPTCWVQQFVSGSKSFSYGSNSNAAGTSPNPTAATGTNRLLFPSYSGSGDQTRFKSPPITTTGTSSVDVTFNWYFSTNGGASLYLTEGVQVQYSTDGTNWTNAGSLIRRYGATTAWSLQTVTLPGGAGNQSTVYVGFLFTSNAGYDSYMDDILIKPTPSCIAPTALNTTAITATGATLNWTAASPAPANGYQWEVRTSGAGGSGMSGLTQSGSVGAGVVTTPSGTLVANTTYTFYVRSDCGGSDYSTWAASATFTPTCTSPSALNTTAITSTGATLNWTAASPAPSNGYQWEVRTSGAGGSGMTGLTQSGSVGAGVVTTPSGTLAGSTTYTFYVRSDCGGSDYSTWTASSSFYTGYCIPAPSSVDGTGITNVSFSTVSNPTGAESGNYGNYSAQIGDVQQSTTVPVNITYMTGYTYVTKIWIDWNDDLDFVDVGEEVYSGTSTSANPTTLAASFAVGTNPLGNHRMRIGGADVGPPTPCYTGTYGTYEDYTVNVIAAPTCFAPTALNTTAVTSNGATLNWTAASPAPSNGYQWEVRTSGAGGSGMTGLTQSGSVGAGVVTTPSGTLVSNTTYTFYVRSDCGGSDFSAWAASATFTPTCTSPSALNTTAITGTGATLNWTAASPAPSNGYQWEVRTSGAGGSGMTGLTQSGSVGAGVVTTPSGTLVGSTTYTFYVRSDCGGGDFSTWAASASFMTPCSALSIPYSEGFESLTVANTLPSCMAASPAIGGKTKTYIASATGTNSALIARTGAKFAAVYWSPSATSGWFFSAPLQLTGGVSYTSSVFYKTDGVAWTDAGLYYGTDATSAAMTNTIVSVSSAAATSYTEIKGVFTPGATGTYYVAFKAYNATSSPNYIAFDDFSVVFTPTDAVDYCNLQYPATATIDLGNSATVYAQAYEPGVTPGGGAGTGISAWIGVSPIGSNSNPNTWTNWTAATYNVESGNNDEYQAAIGSALPAGTYYYASRFQLNGGPYTYGGYTAGGGGFWDGGPNVSGVLTVNPLANDDPCGAITITPGASCSFTAYSSAGATGTTGPPVPGCASYSDNDVWFKVVVPSTGALVFDSNAGTITDSGMAIYSSSDNTCTGTFSLIKCSDDDNGSMSRIIQSGLTPGATIFVRFWDYYDTEGTFSICVYNPCTNLVATVPATGSAVREADLECYDGEWTHYYDNNGTAAVFTDENILLSLNKGSNNIGKIGDVGFAVQQFGALAGAVNVPPDVTGDPNYVQSPMWYVMRRYWNVNVTAQPSMPTVGVRFYYTTADFNAVDAVTPVTTHEQMKFYKINNSLPPNPVYDINPVNGHLDIPVAPTYSDNGYWQLNNGPSASVFAWKKGVYGSEHYAEYLIQTFSGGGGGGGGPQGAFPIELLYFTGHAEANSNIIDWATATEKNNQYQIVERSANGIDSWNEIGRKAGAGTSTSPIAYKLEDTAPLILGYYRLRAVDFDGAEQLSEVISIERESDVLSIVNAFPVPVEKQLILQVNAPVSGEVAVSLTDALGRIVLVQNSEVQRGINQLMIDMGALASGMYQVTVNNGLTTVTRSIMK
jgi:hypothetical protein